MCDRHPPFASRYSHPPGTDRATWNFDKAVALAARRAAERGVRQTVRRHVGPFLRGVWFVQDVR